MDFKWIVQNFGLLNGLRYLWDTATLKVKRRFRKEIPPRFEDLTDEEARDTARMCGIYDIHDRVQLNREWYKLDRTMH